jgi:hypothetical protein
MARPISLICAKCHEERLHFLQGGYWVSNCCKTVWKCAMRTVRMIDFAALNQERRSRGGLHARSATHKKRRDAV